MKTDVITVTNTGEGMEAALEQAAAAAAYRGLDGKNAVHIRLLAEEMLGMIRQITGKTEAEFWVESEGKSFQLHLSAQPVITDGMRKRLLSVSSSGKNAAAVGIMGKLRDIMESSFEPVEIAGSPVQADFYMKGLLTSDDPSFMMPMSFAFNSSRGGSMANWSLRKYRSSLEKERDENAAASEEWDELERSIVANIADEVSISIRSGNVEMIVFKSFE